MDDDPTSPPVPPLPSGPPSEWLPYEQDPTATPSAPPPPSEGTPPSEPPLSKEASRARQNELRRKLVQEDNKWAQSLTLADVIYDKDHPVPLSRLGTKSTPLHSIGGIDAVGLSVDKLRAFCTAQKIAKWAKKTKEEVCELIVETVIMRQQIADRTRQLSDEPPEVPVIADGMDLSSTSQVLDLEWAKQQRMSSVVVDPSNPVLVSKSSTAKTSLVSIGGVEVIRLSTELLKAFCGEHGISRARKDKEDLCRDIASKALAVRGEDAGVDGGEGNEASGSSGGGYGLVATAARNGDSTVASSSLYRSNLAGTKRIRVDEAASLRAELKALKTSLEEQLNPRLQAREEREKLQAHKELLVCHIELKKMIRQLEGELGSDEGVLTEDQRKDREGDIALYRSQVQKLEEEITTFSFPSTSEMDVEETCAV